MPPRLQGESKAMEDTQERTAPEVEAAPQQIDYFGFQERKNYYLPDKVSYFVLEAMNEGAKAKFQKSTRRDLVLKKGSGDASFSIDPAQERHALIRECVKDWNMMRGGQSIPFGEAGLRDFLSLADPKIVEGLELEIRKMNPWLLNELTVEEIDKQIEELQEMRKVAEERERGE